MNLTQVKDLLYVEEKPKGKIVEKPKPRKKKEPAEPTCRSNLCLTAGPKPGVFKTRY